MSFEDQVQQLTSININEIETHYYAAIETAHAQNVDPLVNYVHSRITRLQQVINQNHIAVMQTNTAA